MKFEPSAFFQKLDRIKKQTVIWARHKVQVTDEDWVLSVVRIVGTCRMKIGGWVVKKINAGAECDESVICVKILCSLVFRRSRSL